MTTGMIELAPKTVDDVRRRQKQIEALLTEMLSTFETEYSIRVGGVSLKKTQDEKGSTVIVSATVDVRI
jgi:hypothetical protein